MAVNDVHLQAFKAVIQTKPGAVRPVWLIKLILYSQLYFRHSARFV